MDQMNVPHISFRKVPIMTYMEETHYLHYRPIFDAIKELLSNQEIFDNCTFEFTPLHQEILYGDISINIALSVNIPFYRLNYIDVQRITINIDKYLRYITLFNGWKFIENLSQG